MYKALIVEDLPETCVVIRAALESLPIQLVFADSVAKALACINAEVFDIVFLDLGLPDGHGLDVLTKIRQEYQQQIPVFILTSKDDIALKVDAFSIGADDYITKPFNVIELKARTQGKLERMQTQLNAKKFIQTGPLRLEPDKLAVEINGEAAKVYLSSIEFRILSLFCRQPETIFSRDQILNQIWGSEVYVTDRTIDTHVYMLRKKLGNHGKWIKSVQGQGYRFRHEDL